MKIQLRRDTEANWNTKNPILDQGEIGIDITNNQLKIGDGAKTWMELVAIKPSEDIDLSNYYTKPEVDNLIPDISALATKAELEEKQDKLTAILPIQIGKQFANTIPLSELTGTFNNNITKKATPTTFTGLDNPKILGKISLNRAASNTPGNTYARFAIGSDDNMNYGLGIHNLTNGKWYIGSDRGNNNWTQTEVEIPEDINNIWILGSLSGTRGNKYRYMCTLETKYSFDGVNFISCGTITVDTNSYDIFNGDLSFYVHTGYANVDITVSDVCYALGELGNQVETISIDNNSYATKEALTTLNQTVTTDFNQLSTNIGTLNEELQDKASLSDLAANEAAILNEVKTLYIPRVAGVIGYTKAPALADGNINIYAGTKVVVPTGYDTDGIPKGTVVTTTTNQTLTASTYAGNVYVAIKLNGTLDQNAWGYEEVEDISNVTPGQNVWYYDEAANRIGIKGANTDFAYYDRVVIGVYRNDTEANFKWNFLKPLRNYQSVLGNDLTIEGE